MAAPALVIRQLTELQDYAATFAAMQQFTAQRQQDTPDEVWLLQHPPVLTQGQAGKPEHILHQQGQSHPLPVVQTDRGGQVTWHGPGQLVGYFLLDLNRLNWHVRTLVDFAEQLMLWLLQHYQIVGYSRPDAPGIYVNDCKIGSLGFKIRRGCSYHGFALNIDCDLSGFLAINPCGYAGLQMTRLTDLADQNVSIAAVSQLCCDYLAEQHHWSSVHSLSMPQLPHIISV